MKSRILSHFVSSAYLQDKLEGPKSKQRRQTDDVLQIGSSKNAEASLANIFYQLYKLP